MPLLKHYHDAIKEGAIQHDPAQLEGIKVLQDVWNGLLKPRETARVARSRGLLAVFSKRHNAVIEPVRGAYLWGRRAWQDLVDGYVLFAPAADRKAADALPPFHVLHS